MSKWTPVTGGVPQGSVLGPVLCDIFVNDLHSEIECTLSKFTDNIKLSGAVDTSESWDAIQRDLDKLERWACVNLMRFNKAKYGFLPLSTASNPQYQYRLGDEGLESSPAKKDLGFWWMKSWTGATNVCEQANHTLGYNPSSVGSRSREVILSLFSAPVRPHQEYCIRSGAPGTRRS